MTKPSNLNLKYERSETNIQGLLIKFELQGRTEAGESYRVTADMTRDQFAHLFTEISAEIDDEQSRLRAEADRLKEEAKDLEDCIDRYRQVKNGNYEAFSGGKQTA